MEENNCTKQRSLIIFTVNRAPKATGAGARDAGAKPAGAKVLVHGHSKNGAACITYLVNKLVASC